MSPSYIIDNSIMELHNKDIHNMTSETAETPAEPCRQPNSFCLEIANYQQFSNP